MKKWLLFASLILVYSALAANNCIASGFRLPDQDAKALGMGGAFTAMADNPSAVWYNPAGITQLDGTRVSAGFIAIYPILTHENTDGTTDVAERELFLQPALFGTTTLNDRVALGLGVNSPFGLSTEWSPFSKTSNLATLSKVTTANLNPNVAYKMNNGLSLALGLDYIRLNATLDRTIAPGVLLRLNGDGDGLGANVAVKFRATDQLDLGLSYRSRIKIRVDGDAEVGPLGLSNSAHTEITLPDIILVGASYKASDKLTLNTDLEYTWWSTYDRLEIESATILILNQLGGGPPTNTDVEQREWKNSWILRVGGQYRVSDEWTLRAGLLYDKNPVPSERFETSLPDSDRQGITIGSGYTTGNITIDGAYMYLRFSTRHITNSFAGGSFPIPALDGTYESKAHLLGLTIAYKF